MGKIGSRVKIKKCLTQLTFDFFEKKSIKVGRKAKTTEQFIAEAKAVHGNRYDYSGVKYVNNCTKIKIICPEHGSFEQVPSSHLYGSGCLKCGSEQSAKSQTKTTEQFIAEAKAVHGDRYDYSESEYVHYKTKVKIICPKHGSFEQSPSGHLQSKGCPKCGYEEVAKSQTKNTEQFIAGAKAVHGDRYDYSEVEYVHGRTKIKIICPEHGSFEQTPGDHLRGKGCTKCGYEKGAKSKTKTTEQFIAGAKAVHGDRYDYSEVKYVNAHTKVKIMCPEHGLFEQAPYGHLQSSGCPKCGYEKIKKNTEQFIVEAKAVHGDRYDYSEVEYVHCETKVKIICPKHGPFEQVARSHLQGRGCPKCGSEEAAKSQTKNTEQFIAGAKAVHGDRYDYSEVEYVHCKTKVKIICPKHGPFEQVARSHLKGSGCPTCKSSKGELRIQSILESLSIKYEREKRFKSCKNKFPLPFDFFLPDLNILIEYDGEHHFRPVIYGGNKAQAQENFKLRQKTDKIKTCWAKSSPYTLHRIKYDEDIEKKMKEIIA